MTWSIAIHAGAGTIDRDAPQAKIDQAKAGLQAALDLGTRMLESGASALDTVEAVILVLEDDPQFNAGRGAVFTATGGHELDASIMDGTNLGCGAVTGVTTVRHPITLARRVMEQSPHVLFAGPGAEAFADTQADIERVPGTFFDTDARREALERWKQRQAEAKETFKSTVGCVVLDRAGNLAAGTSTGGMTGKRFGRVGDSPIVGAGTYADNKTCAVSCTGTGEEYIRHGVARDIAARMAYLGNSPTEAAHAVIHTVLQPEDGGVIVVGRNGSIAMEFNTGGMYRAAGDSTGRREVAIW
ncbi:MAG: isoaspartyl peptidase/L-asparaginase [Planctomycetota bacterium]